MAGYSTGLIWVSKWDKLAVTWNTWKFPNYLPCLMNSAFAARSRDVGLPPWDQ